MPQIHAILKHWHPMIGWDFHIPWVPGTPAPAPVPVVYKTGATLSWVAGLVGLQGVTKMAKSHVSQGWGFTMLQDTDIGTMIPHIGPPSLLLPLDILFSASKSYFFTTQYKAEGANIAVALAIIVNPNLNCGTPIPTPTGPLVIRNRGIPNSSIALTCRSTRIWAASWSMSAPDSAACAAMTGPACGRACELPWPR